MTTPRDAHRPATRALELATSIPWAILQPDLERILAIAQRELDHPSLIERQAGAELDNTQTVTIRDGIALIPLRGPLFRYGNLFTRISGATSLEIFARDFTAAVEDRQVRAIALAIDSPGGEVNGTEEAAQLIYEARGTKPIVAHASGMIASGAFWLGSAADEIVGLQTTMAGSVGAVIEVVDFREMDAKAGIRVFEFLSSVSPRKRPDPATEEGAADIQRIVDQLGLVFVEIVARNRDLTVDEVLARYGQGAVLVGTEALAAGLLDRLSTLEELHAELVEQTSSQIFLPFRPVARAAGASPEAPMRRRVTTTVTEEVEPAADAPPAPSTPAARAAEERSMPEKEKEMPAPLTLEQLRTQYPAHVTAIATDAATAERTRILAIDALNEPDHATLLATCKQDPTVTAGEAALRIRAADQAKREAAIAARAAEEKSQKAPAPLAESEVEAASAPALVQSILGTYARATGRATAAH